MRPSLTRVRRAHLSLALISFPYSLLSFPTRRRRRHCGPALLQPSPAFCRTATCRRDSVLLSSTISPSRRFGFATHVPNRARRGTLATTARFAGAATRDPTPRASCCASSSTIGLLEPLLEHTASVYCSVSTTTSTSTLCSTYCVLGGGHGVHRPRVQPRAPSSSPSAPSRTWQTGPSARSSAHVPFPCKNARSIRSKILFFRDLILL